MSSRRSKSSRARKKSRQNPRAQGGIPGMSPKAMQKALGQIDTKEIDNVVEVIVRTETEEIVLNSPEVTIMNMGQEQWIISPKGTSRRPLSAAPIVSEGTTAELEDIELSEADINLVVSTAGVTEEEATKALKKSGGDIAAAIMSLR